MTEPRKSAPRKPQDRRPKKATAKKPTGNGRVDFDMNSLERGVEEVLPFTFAHGDKTFTLSDPAEIDLADVVAVGDDPMANVSLLVRLLGDEQYKALIEAGPLPQWKIPPLINAWNQHYGTGDEGKGDASSD